MFAALAALALSGGPVITIAGVGDVMLARGVERAILEHGPTYPFAQMRALLSKADIAFANLECPITERPILTAGLFGFHVSPKLAACLSTSGLDVVSIANNHILDCGPAGRADTVEALSAIGINGVGAEPVIINVKGVSVAFVAFSEYWSEGIGGQAPATPSTVRQRVAAARQRGDIVVASFHWGAEGAANPTDSQRALARAAHEAGAVLVIGHHPHVLQPLQYLGKTLVAYSMGNFVFDPPAGSESQSSVLVCRISKAGIQSATLMPVRIVRDRPRPATPAESRQIWHSLAPKCEDVGTSLVYHRTGFSVSPLVRRTNRASRNVLR